jgi:NADH dehydrogenase FAD-containing subunit
MTDAEMIRNRILQAFERAEALDDPKRPDGLLTFVVGAEPTGVEIAGDCRSSSDRRLGRR